MRTKMIQFSQGPLSSLERPLGEERRLQPEEIGITTAQTGGVLQYGPFHKAFPIAVLLAWLVLFLSIMVFINPPPAGPEGGPLLLAEFVFLAIVLPWMLFIEFFGTRVTVNPEGLQMQSVWLGKRFLKWKDAEAVYYSSWRPGFVVKGHGLEIVLNDGLRELALFAEVAHAQLPPQEWAKAPGRLHLLLPKGPYD